MKTTYFVIATVITVLMSSSFICSSVSQSGKMGDEFYNYLKNNDYNSIVAMLDTEALVEYSKEEWIELFASRNKFFGELKSYKNIGFHTNSSKGMEITKLSYEVNNPNGLVYEEIEFVKRGDDYKILVYRFATDLAALKGN